MDNIFEASGIYYIYDGGAEALSGLSMSLAKDEKLGVVGANGSGKSTLLLHLIGCLTPGTGELKYKGRPVTRGTRKALRRETGFLFQNPDDQLFLPTIGEDVAFAPANAGATDAEIEKNVESALSAVGIAGLKERSPWKLSGGEKTLAALAGLLAACPETLLLDEPTSGLDPAARENFIGILKGLSCTMAIATHDLDLVLDVCSRVIFLRDGKVFGESAVPGLMADEVFLRRCGLRLPMTLRRRGAVPCGAFRSDMTREGISCEL